MNAFWQNTTFNKYFLIRHKDQIQRMNLIQRNFETFKMYDYIM